MEQTNKTKQYEIICILQPGLNEDESNQMIENNTKTIEKQGGQVVKAVNWGLKKLAYEINKHPKGIYTYHHFNGHGEVVKELERTLHINEKVMKYMTVQLDTKKKKSENSSSSNKESQDR